jgi:hypothetical protein
MLQELIHISSKSCTEFSINWKHHWNGHILMQDAAISKETLFNVHHTTGTQFVDSGI